VSHSIQSACDHTNTDDVMSPLLDFCAAFPQVILNGELIGGLDIFKDSLESGEWDEMYNSAE
jgi:glutaredoxin-related protein